MTIFSASRRICPPLADQPVAGLRHENNDGMKIIFCTIFISNPMG
jgi:hypothetical protein